MACVSIVLMPFLTSIDYLVIQFIKAGGAVNGGAYAPFILTVDWLGWVCYMHLFLSMLLSHLNISYIICNGHERHIQIFRCNL